MPCKGKPWDPNLTWYEIRRSPQRTLRWIYRRLTSPLRGLPTVYIAGVKKSGTTSLFRYLIAHPRVWAPFRKEIKFFTYHAYLSTHWYRANFPWRWKLREGLTLDATPNYLMHPCFAERLYHLMPRARLIVLLRHPVHRVLSHYFHNRRLGLEPLSLEEAIHSEAERLKGEVERIAADPCYTPGKYLRFGYLTESRYIEHLNRLWRFFPREQVLVLRSEDLFLMPQKTLNDVATFLGLESWNVETRIYNKGDYQIVEALQGVIQWLQEYFKPYNQRLYAALGRDMEWE